MTLAELPFIVTVQGARTRKYFRNRGDLRDKLLCFLLGLP